MDALNNIVVYKLLRYDSNKAVKSQKSLRMGLFAP